MSKISDFKLEKVVATLRAEGKNTADIHKRVNELIPADYERISYMAVDRYIKAKERTGEIRYLSPKQGSNLNPHGVDEAEDVNPYEETLKLIEDCDMQIAKLKKIIDKTGKGKNQIQPKNDPIPQLATFIAKKQDLLKDIAKYQKDMADFTEVKSMMILVYETLQEVSPEAYELFKNKIQEKHTLKSILKNKK